MHKIAFYVGPLPVYWYGALIAVGFLAGLWTASRRGLLDNLAPEKIMDTGPWIIVGAIIGARALHVMSYWNEEFAHKPILDIFNLRQGGLVFYGGFIGATVSTMLYLRWKKVRFWTMVDALTPSLPLGAAFGRIGCLMNGCCFGKPTSLPWAIHFPAEHETHGLGVHPTQIYDSLLNLALYAGLAWLYRRKKFDGQIFSAYLLGYALLRSFVECFRGDYMPSEYFFGGWVTPGQFVSLGIFAAGLILFWAMPRRMEKRVEVEKRG